MSNTNITSIPTFTYKTYDEMEKLVGFTTKECPLDHYLDKNAFIGFDNNNRSIFAGDYVMVEYTENKVCKSRVMDKPLTYSNGHAWICIEDDLNYVPFDNVYVVEEESPEHNRCFNPFDYAR